MNEPTEKDYGDYLRGLIKGLQEDIKELKTKATNQQINNMVLAQRIYDLEEKERQRARDEHEETEVWKKLNEKASMIEEGFIERDEHDRDMRE
jgi:hypothetical protein